MRLRDFAIVEFARAWQEEAGASLVDPDIVDAVADRPADDDHERLLHYADALLQARVADDEGLGALTSLRATLSGLHVAAPLLGLLAGASLLAATLPPPDARPVNVFVFVGEGVLLPALFGLGTILLSLGAGRPLTSTHWVAWAVGLLSRGALATRLGRLTGRVLRQSGVAGPLLGSLSHLFWIGALASFTGLAAWRFLFTDYLFAWSSTMPLTAQGVEGFFSTLAAPVGWLPGVHAPGAEQVAVSEWASLLNTYAWDSGDPNRDEALRKGWYGLLLAAAGFWGLLPRVIAFFASRALLRRRILRALSSPGTRAVLDALSAPALTVLADGDGSGPAGSLLPPGRSSPTSARAPSEAVSGPDDPSTPHPRRAGLDLVAFACAPPSDAVLRRLRLERLGLSGDLHRIDEDDDEPAMDAALEALGAAPAGTGGAIASFAVTDSPGRLREAFLRDVVAAVHGAPVHVVLVGVDAYRRSPRGGSLDDRLAAWRALGERVGVPADRIHPDEEVL